MPRSIPCRARRASTRTRHCAIAGVSVADLDGGTLTTTLSGVERQAHRATGGGVTGSGTATVTITGTASQINAALTTLAYTGNLNFNGARHAHRHHQRRRVAGHRHGRHHGQSGERSPGAGSRRGQFERPAARTTDQVHRWGRRRRGRRPRRPDHDHDDAISPLRQSRWPTTTPSDVLVAGVRPRASTSPCRSRCGRVALLGARRRWPLIERALGRSRSTTPAPRRRPPPASSTLSSTTAPAATRHMPSSRSRW